MARIAMVSCIALVACFFTTFHDRRPEDAFQVSDVEELLTAIAQLS